MKYIFILFFTLLLTFLHGVETINQPISSAIEKIKSYKAKPSQTPPTPEEYRQAGIRGITRYNVVQVNEKVANINMHPNAKIYPFNYDTKRDYFYNFDHTKAQRDHLKIDNSTINLDKFKPYKNYTALLKLSVDTTEMGKYFKPSITVSTEKNSCTHSFEPGAKGIRYLNISSLDLNGSKKIKISSKFIKLEEENTELILFKNPDLSKETIMIIAPHPDDAEIAAYGLYSQNHENTYIVTITAGDAGPHRFYDRIFPLRKEQYLEKGRIRTFDSLTVPLLGNIPPENSINLGFFDGTLQKMYGSKLQNIKGLYIGTSDIDTFRSQNISPLAKELKGGSNWNALVDNLAYLIKKIEPTIIITPYSALDWHPDHKFSTAAVAEALMKLDRKKGKLFLYTNHLPASEYYPFGKEGSPVTLPPNYGRSIYFDAIYSHQVSDKDQRRKVLALDKMSDILLDKKWSNLWNICEGKIPFLCQDLSYFRRSIRSNEFFFVVDIDKLYDRKVLEAILN